MLIHEICTTWAMHGLGTCVRLQVVSQLGYPKCHGFVLLVYICKQVSFQVGHSNLCCCEPAMVMAGVNVNAAIRDWNSCTSSVMWRSAHTD